MGYKAIKTSPDSHWAITVKGRNRGADFYHKSWVMVLIFCTVMRYPFQQDRWYPESLDLGVRGPFCDGHIFQFAWSPKVIQF